MTFPAGVRLKTGTMTGSGFTIQLTAFGRATLITAAREMRPVP